MKRIFLISLFYCLSFTVKADVGNIAFSFINDSEVTAILKIRQKERSLDSPYIEFSCTNYKNGYMVTLFNFDEKKFSNSTLTPQVLFKDINIKSTWKIGYKNNKSFIYKMGDNTQFISNFKKNGQVLINFIKEKQVYLFSPSDKVYFNNLIDEMSKHCSLNKIN